MWKDLSMITPAMDDPDLVFADSVVSCGEGNCVAVVLENRGDMHRKPRKGMMLGNVKPVCMVKKVEEETLVKQSDSFVDLKRE